MEGLVGFTEEEITELEGTEPGALEYPGGDPLDKMMEGMGEWET